MTAAPSLTRTLSPARSQVSELVGAAAPIGIFDSGIGGLSVLQAIQRLLPREPLLFCADSLYVPYGLRDDAFVAARTLASAQWLVAQGAKALVIACNTATSQAIHLLRERFDLPLIGVEPGVKPAVLLSKSGVAGVLATAVTLRSEKFRRLVALYSSQCRLLCTAGLGLVEAIEAGEADGPVAEALLRQYLEPMLDAGADTLALGCTHYPFLKPSLQRLTGSRLTLVDTSDAIARQLQRLLDRHGLQADANGEATASPLAVRFCATGDGTQLRRGAATLLGLDIEVEHVEIETVLPALTPGRAALG